MKKTTWQILSKHLPPRTDLYEPTNLALALHTCHHGVTVLLSHSQIHLRAFQSKDCLLATLLRVRFPTKPSLYQSPRLKRRSLTILLSQQVQVSSLQEGKCTRFLLRRCLAVISGISGLYTGSEPSCRVYRGAIFSLSHHSTTHCCYYLSGKGK